MSRVATAIRTRRSTDLRGPEEPAADARDGSGHYRQRKPGVTLGVVRDQEGPRIPAVKQQADEDGPEAISNPK